MSIPPDDIVTPNLNVLPVSATIKLLTVFPESVTLNPDATGTKFVLAPQYILPLVFIIELAKTSNSVDDGYATLNMLVVSVLGVVITIAPVELSKVNLELS